MTLLMDLYEYSQIGTLERGKQRSPVAHKLGEQSQHTRGYQLLRMTAALVYQTLIRGIKSGIVIRRVQTISTQLNKCDKPRTFAKRTACYNCYLSTALTVHKLHIILK